MRRVYRLIDKTVAQTPETMGFPDTVKSSLLNDLIQRANDADLGLSPHIFQYLREIFNDTR